MAVRQHEFWQNTLQIQPVESIGPRLWVRRLVIWKEPGGEVVRDISLRPGLNIVWTPDDSGIGHGGGKTLFCRLLRYCLGEDRFAPEEQRESIAAVYLNGIVGAEVMLDNTCWVIVRPLGNRRRHYAVPDASLEDIATCQVAPTGVEPFIDAVEDVLLGAEVAGLIPSHRQDQRAWLIALAWLTRDQECRFDHVLDWRSNFSDSDSPARGLTQTEKLDTLRALLQAITPEEKVLRREIATLDEGRRLYEQEASHRHWELTRLKKRLLTELRVPEDAFTDGATAIVLLRKTAQDNLALLLGAAAFGSADQVFIKAREAYDQARARASQLEQRIAILEAELPCILKAIGLINGELPALRYAFEEANSFPCPICEVPIDRVLAEKCDLSHKLPNIAECRKRLEVSRRSLREEEKHADAVRNEIARIKPDLALANQHSQRHKLLYLKQEMLQRTKNAEWYAAQRSVDEVEHLAELMGKSQTAEGKIQQATTNVEQKRSQISTLMELQEQVIEKLAEKFDAIIRVLVGPDANGEIKLTGKGLSLVVRMGGNRSTSAIDSLKVVAFDLAALCLSVEGKTKVPAFLVHDSPREADLGLQLYEKIFHLADWLEKNAMPGTPMFQYIITTTTKPPEDLAKEPWLRLRLSGAAAEERLLRCNL